MGKTGGKGAEDFGKMMNSPRVRLLIAQAGIKMPIGAFKPYQIYGGYFPPNGREKFIGGIIPFVILFVIVCLCALCCCRGLFHYLFSRCFCTSHPEVQEGDKADPLVLKKAEATHVYPDSDADIL